MRLVDSTRALLALVWLGSAAGCSDAAGAADAALRVDASGLLPDLTLAECTTVERWPATAPAADYLLVDGVGLTYAEARDSEGETFALLRVEDFHREAGYPVTREVDSTLRAADCGICAFVADGCSGEFARCERIFLIQAGTVTIAHSDLGQRGRMEATVSDGLFRQWDRARDLPLTEGACYRVNSGALAASWGN